MNVAGWLRRPFPPGLLYGQSDAEGVDDRVGNAFFSAWYCSWRFLGAICQNG